MERASNDGFGLVCLRVRWVIFCVCLTVFFNSIFCLFILILPWLGFAKMQNELWKQLVFGVPLIAAGYFVLL
jgi:hypothetical protein